MNIALETPIAIIGLGLSGESAYRFLIASGYKNSDLILFDEKSPKAQASDPEVLFSKHNPQTLVISPGVPLSKSWIQAAKSRGVKITSELNLAASIIKDEIIVGITGSVGKSTTTALIGDALSKIDKNTFVGGNLGTAFCDYALSIVEKSRPRAKWIILELSSYQLENCEELSLDLGVITYFTPNHLERYANLQEYYNTKLKLIDFCKGPCILNQDSTELLSSKSSLEAKYGEKIRWIGSQNFNSSLPLAKARLLGEHNQQNLRLAAEVLSLLGIPKEKMQSLLEYPGLPHRTEYVAEKNGIHFINDSKATSIESVLVSVKACLKNLQADAKIHLLLGGRDKNLPWQDLNELISNKNILYYFFGESKSLIPQKTKLKGSEFMDVASCFKGSLSNAKKGDWILFSPGGTSLDQFKNFEERGNFFKSLVENSCC